MKKTSRWAAFVGIVCGAELIAAIVIGGAGLAALVSIETALVVVLLGGVTLRTILSWRRSHRNAASVQAGVAQGATDACSVG